MARGTIMELYQEYIHKSRYARYLPDLKRRETWEETVQRYMDFMVTHLALNYDYNLSDKTERELFNAIYNMEIMPSMRALMTAGPALERDHVAGYNCAYVPIDDRKVFDEIMYVLLCGTGVGFSVERRYVSKLPEIPDTFYPASATINVADSKIGWASALRKYISLLYDGQIAEVDYSRVRGAGSVLKTFGGRASGPEPLRELLQFVLHVFEGAKGRKLNDLECHDIVCKIAESVVVGGVRRSALISLSNLQSERLRGAKQGTWYYADPQRALSNNSVCYTETPDTGVYLREWTSLYESKSGERGIFNRATAETELPERREPGHEWGTNPCSEIILRPRQFCNLTEVVVREDDNDESLKRKIRLATILGTIQATLTNFRYLSKRWQSNCEEERLLGVSLTGIQDHPTLNTRSDYNKLEPLLKELKDYAVNTNARWARELDVQPSSAITCVKPSGTVSQLTDSSSGIHPRYAEYYIRRVRQSKTDPLSQALIDAGVPYETDVTNESTWVFTFPQSSPKGSVYSGTVGAIAQLEHWQIFNEAYCEHKPSVSIYVKEDEWMSVGAWVYENFDALSGVSFFPVDDHSYRQAPYQSITKAEYQELMETFPVEIDWNVSEEQDSTTASQELACAGGACEL
jgi:ribonucleoside-triphosphate reductase (thioredoxin)